MIIGIVDKDYSRIRVLKVLSIALNAFVPNILDYKMVPSLFDLDIFFKFEDNYDVNEETDKALEYCKNFVEKVCRNTNFKLLDYISFQEFIPFLSNPLDEVDAESVVKNISPYKALKEPISMEDYKGIDYKSEENDHILLSLDSIDLSNRKGIFPKDLVDINENSIDPVTNKSYIKTIELMKILESGFVYEWEKLDLLLDLASMNWDACSKHKKALENVQYYRNDNSDEIYRCLLNIRAKINLDTALEKLLNHVLIKKDVIYVKTLLLKQFNIHNEKKDKIILEGMSDELINALNETEKLKESIDEKYLQEKKREEKAPEELEEEIRSNPYYTLIINMRDEKLVKANERLNNENSKAIAEGIKRSNGFTYVDMRNITSINNR